LGIPSPKASDFDRNLDLKIRGEQQTTSEQQTVGGRRLQLTSAFQIEISCKKIEFFLKCYPKIISGGLHNRSGCLHWVIS